MLHAAALADDQRFAAHSNHGFYFAAGQLAMAHRFPGLSCMRDAEEQALSRLHRLMDIQFTPEGVHREHSPDYHRMVLDTFRGLLESGLFPASEFKQLSDRIQEALSWFVLPNGSLAMFGDSPHRQMTRDESSAFDNKSLQFVLSGGRLGKPPGEPIRAFPASGYVVIRSGWPSGPDDFAGWSYLAQTCAFHSRVHKHADDLSFVWYDRGHELLTDAGRYGYLEPTSPGSALWKEGYWYADPNRVYVESTRAHNTVEIDGRSFPRRRVTPYGSALKKWGEWAGIYFTVSGVRHMESIQHSRVLLFRPEEWLIVYDFLRDDNGKPHQFAQHFHFAPELEIVPGNHTLSLDLPEKAGRLHMTSLLDAEAMEPMKAQEEPELSGWISREDGEMIPCWTAGYLALDVTQYAFVTLFSFSELPPVAERAQNIARQDGLSVAVRWGQDAAIHIVEFSLRDPESFDLDYRIKIKAN
jgi:hypothetical protein